MFSLDMRTAIFSFVLISAINTFVISLMLIQYKSRYKGVDYMFYCFVLQTIALIMILLRGTIPDWISLDLGNFISIAGIIIFFRGLEAYLGEKSSVTPNLILLTVFTVVHTWFTFAQPDLGARHLNVSVAWLILFVQCTWLLLFRIPLSKRRLTLHVTLVSIAFCLISLVRIAKYFLYGHGENYFDSDWFDTSVIVIAQLLLILLTYSLEHMFGNRLLQDIKVQEEKFSKAFYTSSFSIILTRFDDGRIIEVNRGFIDKTGYSMIEISNKTTAELNLFININDRLRILKELNEKGKIFEEEIVFRKKSGELMTGLLSSEIITIDNEKCILSSFNDITERKRNESERTELYKNLAESEEKYRAFFNNSLDAIFLTSPDGSIYSANPAACAMLGRTEDQIRSLGRNGLVDTDDPRLAKALREREISGRFYGELTMIRSNGEKFPVELSTSIFTGKDGKIMTIMIGRDISERKKNEAEIEKSKALLEKLNQHIFDVRENERRAIGLSLHDDLGQRLTSLYLDVAWLKKRIDNPSEGVSKKMNEMSKMINETIENVKETSSFLRPSILFELGLIPAITTHLQKFEKQSGIKCHLHCSPTEFEVGDQLSLVLFRVFQESLTNIARHAGASYAEVILNSSKNNITMMIKDDGKGISKDKLDSLTSMGIAGMAERIKGVNGKLEIRGNNGSGTTVAVTIPVKTNNNDKGSDN